ncbi:MAG: hypothetical protein R2762_07460 [Bryobacteraceae bacterium]
MEFADLGEAVKRRTFVLSALALGAQSGPRSISGIYPHLAMFNEDNECGTGGVVPWAGRLWVVTYSPHRPAGSADKLYEITPDLRQIVRPESIGGTPANRMIHRESNQLFLGPYAIDGDGNVRVIPYEKAYGRPTGNARHLTDPVSKIYLATMEEGFYEIDVRTLAVKQLYEDGNLTAKRDPTVSIAGALLPGYHGKGLYSGQGRLVYANNGEYDTGGMPPSTPSGCLAEWDGRDWKVVRRNQFTEVTGPGDLYGNANASSDPIWSLGWDHRSLILMVREGGAWHSFRLPKASHAYDGAHGWNTEWPRIRDVGEPDMLMTMHGMFWKFPKGFGVSRAAGISPRSAYIRVVGDFARWQDRIVLGCDDAAKNEFLNKRNCKGSIAGPGQSQSNLWFLDPGELDGFGPALGRGGVWVGDSIRGGDISEPFLFAGFDRRMVHVSHSEGEPVTFHFEADVRGDGRWTKLRELQVPAMGYAWHVFDATDRAEWVRVRTSRDAAAATVFFQYSNQDRRTAEADPIFSGVCEAEASAWSGGLLWNRGDNRRTLLFAARQVTGGKASPPALYELGEGMVLRRLEDTALLDWMESNLAPPVSTPARPLVEVDAASVIYYDEEGKRWRLPKGPAVMDNPGPLGQARMAREASTERDLLSAHGSFYELPSNNAGGIAMVRPVCTHHRRIHDFTSHRGLLVLAGVDGGAASEHVIRSDDGRVALWLGAIDDLWKFGKPRGEGGPWLDTPVIASIPSDPYLMTGYDRKQLRMRHDAAAMVSFRVEVDFSGTGSWRTYRSFPVAAGHELSHDFPDGFGAYWVRAVVNRDCAASAIFRYS